MNPVAPSPLSPDAIRLALRSVPSLPSLNSIHQTLQELLAAEEKSTSRLALVIGRDPGLASRLLQRVNSPEFGLQQKVKSLEDAVIHVGSRTLRDLVLMAPVVSDMKSLAGNESSSWRALWRHSVGTALLTQELIASAGGGGSDLDYIAGLMHDVGWIVSKRLFPDHFAEMERRFAAGKSAVVELTERSVLGVPHTLLGGWYLEQQRQEELLVKSALFHSVPEGAGAHARTIAAVQIADLFMASIGCGHLGDPVGPDREAWKKVGAWKILFPSGNESTQRFAIRRLEVGGTRLLTLVDSVC
jgi:HD-like signal output (HDOD) protein